jgi:ketosteroid isomerase-like protein
MDHVRRAPEAIALSFVDRINRGDVDGLAALMTEDHQLRVFDEPPQAGRAVVTEGWRGYARAFPRYRIHPHRLAVKGDQVAVYGHTTGSHLALPDAEESELTLIWIARIAGDLVASWTLVEDTPHHRRAFDLDS